MIAKIIYHCANPHGKPFLKESCGPQYADKISFDDSRKETYHPYVTAYDSYGNKVSEFFVDDNGRPHRESGPAYEFFDGRTYKESYWLNGIFYPEQSDWQEQVSFLFLPSSLNTYQG